MAPGAVHRPQFGEPRSFAGRQLALTLRSYASMLRDWSDEARNPNLTAWLRTEVPKRILAIEQEIEELEQTYAREQIVALNQALVARDVRLEVMEKADARIRYLEAQLYGESQP